jgi:hypothetical protein
MVDFSVNKRLTEAKEGYVSFLSLIICQQDCLQNKWIHATEEKYRYQ